jgi:hypothetical protein
MVGRNIGNAKFLRAGALKGIRKGSVANVTIQNIDVELRAQRNPLKNMPGIVIAGLPDQFIADITLENISIYRDY